MDGAGVAPNTVSLVVMVLALVSGLVFVRAHLFGGGALDMEWTGLLLSHLGEISKRIPVEVVALLAVFFVWWRGLGLGSRTYTHDSVGFSFRAGVVLLLWNAALSALVGGRVPILGFAFAYFFFGLLAVGLARVYELERQPESGGVVSTRFWLGATIGGILATLFVALIAVQLVTVGNLQAVVRWLNPLWKILQAIASALVYLFSLILQPLLNWIVQFFRTRVFQELPEGTPGPLATPEPFTQPPVAPPAYLEYIKYAIVLLFFLGILLFVAFSVRRMRARSQEGRAEEREIEWEWSPPGKRLAGALRAGLDRLAELLRLAGQFGLGERFRAAASIRWIYANVLRLAAEAGHARQPSQTPYEFLPVLQASFQGFDSELKAITEAYVRSHYGQVPDSPEALQHIRDCWERLRKNETTGDSVDKDDSALRPQRLREDNEPQRREGRKDF
jgi:hypothetical protein